MGRNGSYVVLRQSAQDVRSFSRSTAAQSDAVATGGNGRSPLPRGGVPHFITVWGAACFFLRGSQALRFVARE